MATELTPSQMSDKLRAMVLSLKPEDIGLRKENLSHSVYAIIMEVGLPEGSYTLVSVADGSTSLYFSNGGGIIGGGEYKDIRDTSSYFLSGAQYFFNKAQKVTVFPKPLAGYVIFYFITYDGVRSYTAMENDLGNGKDQLSKLFFAAQNVITKLRKIDEK